MVLLAGWPLAWDLGLVISYAVFVSIVIVPTTLGICINVNALSYSRTMRTIIIVISLHNIISKSMSSCEFTFHFLLPLNPHYCSEYHSKCGHANNAANYHHYNCCRNDTIIINLWIPQCMYDCIYGLPIVWSLDEEVGSVPLSANTKAHPE